MFSFLFSYKGIKNLPESLWNLKGAALLFLISLIGVLFYPFHLSQNFYAGYVIASFATLAIVDFDFSFLVLLFLTQFFIGDFYRPYLWILNVLVLILFLVWIVSIIRHKSSVNFPAWWLVLPFVLIVFLAFPLTFKEIILDFKIYGFTEFLKLIAHSGTIYWEFWFKELYLCLSSMLMYLTVVNILKGNNDLFTKSGYVLGMALIVASIYGILHVYKFLPIEGHFLSINFSDHSDYKFEGMLTSFGWSVAFIAEYFAIVFPMILFMIFTRRELSLKVLFSLLSSITIFSTFLTYRRAVFVVIGVEIIFFLFLLYLQNSSKRDSIFPRNWGNFIPLMILAIIVIVTGSTFLQKKVLKDQLSKISWKSYERDPRYIILSVCGKMLEYEPILGLGSGGYTQNAFRFYGKYDWILDEVRGSPHSIYLKMLSERGFLGFLSFIFLTGGFIYFGFKGLRILKGNQKYFLMAVMTGLGGILVYGLVMDFFWLPAIRILFWIYLAFIAVLVKPVIPKITFTKKKVIIIGIIFVALFGYRLWRVRTEPISEHYEAGFYRWEIPKKGKDKKPYRLTSSHALKVLTVKGDLIYFRVCSNKPDIKKNHQFLNIYINGKLVKRIELKDKHWKKLVVPMISFKGKNVFIDFQVEGTWIPYQYGMGKSKRVLGVIVSRIEQE